ncbi:MAG: hypothetical protein ACJ8AT_22970 [Hyalangium sp.]|uniref:hypothetical protein n=1 Tax=Hyalangium sp. TaxID=2028555 RepID=UPI00389A4001
MKNDVTLKQMQAALDKLSAEVRVVLASQATPHSPASISDVAAHGAATQAARIFAALQLDERLSQFEKLRAEELAKRTEEGPLAVNVEIGPFSPFLRWSTLAFALIGLLTGLFAGMSQTPVIGTLLPLLFGLLGGAGGFFIAKENLRASGSLQRVRIISVSVVVFASCCLLGSIWGVSRRTGAPAWTFFWQIQASPESIAGYDTQAPDNTVKLVMLRRRLQALGATKPEVDSILDRAAAALKTAERKPPPSVPQNLIASLRALAKSLETAAKEVALVESQGGQPKNYQKMAPRISLGSADINDWADRIEGRREVPLDRLGERLSDIETLLNSLVGGSDDKDLWLLSHDAPRRAIWDALLSLHPLSDTLGLTNFVPDPVSPEVEEDADRLLRILNSQASASSIKDLFGPSRVHPFGFAGLGQSSPASKQAH